MKTKYGNAKINNKGYYQITSAKEGNGNKLLHRLIAVDYFGDWIDKPLIDGEKIEIHHIDGDKTNNCILNMLPLPRSEHRKLHNPKGENHRNYGKKLSEETKQKIKENHWDNSGENHPMYGKNHSEETKRKISDALKGENHPKYWQGKHLSKEHKKNISESHKGMSYSNESKLNMSKSRNTTGYYRVNKHKTKNTKQGFIYQYWYSENDKQKVISSVDIEKLEAKVKARGLKWYKFEKND